MLGVSETSLGVSEGRFGVDGATGRRSRPLRRRLGLRVPVGRCPARRVIFAGAELVKAVVAGHVLVGSELVVILGETLEWGWQESPRQRPRRCQRP
jgi:hypothetical protein